MTVIEFRSPHFSNFLFSLADTVVPAKKKKEVLSWVHRMKCLGSMGMVNTTLFPSQKTHSYTRSHKRLYALHWLSHTICAAVFAEQLLYKITLASRVVLQHVSQEHGGVTSTMHMHLYILLNAIVAVNFQFMQDSNACPDRIPAAGSLYNARRPRLAGCTTHLHTHFCDVKVIFCTQYFSLTQLHPFTHTPVCTGSCSLTQFVWQYLL